MLLARGWAAKSALAAVVALGLVCAVWSACHKTQSGGPVAAGSSSAPVVNRLAAVPDAGPAALRDVAIWASAREGQAEDLASLATHEGAVGLIEAADEPTLRTTALRAMGYARGWAQLPFLAAAASASEDEEAKIALEAVLELSVRPRRAEDVEDEAELREGCEKLGALARDTERAKARRIGALRALRMMPCPKQDLPTDLDAR
jgi:hypothetical protein